ncbi:MAG: AEC family transporter [Clostridia bacterium]|nr:AEC family transporter [Clostridia bacterium]
MQDFLFALNAIAPIVLFVLLGYILKRIGLLPKPVASQLNKIVFRVFLPIMLALNVYKIELGTTIDFSYILWGIGFLLVLFLVMLWPICRLVPERSQRGVVLQAIFRSNYALIGIPLATALFGEEGAILSTIMSAFMIPVFNILAVFCLTLFSDKKASYKSILLGILKNPLILGIACGCLLLLCRMLFSHLGIGLRLTHITPIYKVLNDLSGVATPIALLCLGANFEFSAIPALKRQITIGVLLRCVIVPILGIGGALLLGCFESGHFAVFIALFATPLAVSTVPMAQEMDGDHALAGQILVFTTIISAFTIFLCTYALRLLGIF